MTTAQLIESEHGQTVRLPEEYRFAGHEVRIRREGNQFIPEPLGDGWAWLGEPHLMTTSSPPPKHYNKNSGDTRKNAISGISLPAGHQ